LLSPDNNGRLDAADVPAGEGEETLLQSVGIGTLFQLVPAR
jgi:hypothetical protein